MCKKERSSHQSTKHNHKLSSTISAPHIIFKNSSSITHKPRGARRISNFTGIHSQVYANNHVGIDHNQLTVKLHCLRIKFNYFKSKWQLLCEVSAWVRSHKPTQQPAFDQSEPIVQQYTREIRHQSADATSCGIGRRRR